VPPVRILLPPSETKSVGGTGLPLDLSVLSFPELTPLRRRLIDLLVGLAADPAQARAALGTTPRQDEEIDRNRLLGTSPTAPAGSRYTGVLYDALDIASLRGAAAERARTRLLVGSALFGALGPDDPVPAYRLSAGSQLPGLGTLATFWRPALVPVLSTYDGLVVDLRSSGYVGLAPVPQAVSVRVLTDAADGSRSVVSHANKSTKGRIARALVSSRALVDDLPSLLRVLRRAGFTVERHGPAVLDVVLR